LISLAYLGLKEVWQISDSSPHFEAGFIQHTLGWPLQSSLMDKTFGGTFMYHMEPNLILIGMVIGLDYENPYLNPYKVRRLPISSALIRRHNTIFSNTTSYHTDTTSSN
jgi:electron-transferring-flavoprotein dehydrogenase